MPTRAFVVGGGLTGLAAASTLADAGRATTLIEVTGRVGGSICTRHEAGFVLEAGPALLSTSTPLPPVDPYTPVNASWAVPSAGAQALADALMARFSACGGQLITHMAVTGLAAFPDGSLQLCLENGLALDADAVVLALPAPRAAQILRAAAPDAAARLDRVPQQRWACAGLGWRVRPALDAAKLSAADPWWHTDGPPHAPDGGAVVGVMYPLAQNAPNPTAPDVAARLGLPTPDAAVVRVWLHPPYPGLTANHPMTPQALSGLPPRVVVAATVQHHTADLTLRLRAGEAATQGLRP